MSKDNSIGWHPEMFKRADSLDQLVQEARGLFDDILANTLQREGYRFYPWLRARTDYWLAYRVVLDPDISGDIMVQQFGMAPGFATGESQQYDKGTLIIDLVDSRNNRSVWRSSAQGLVAPDIPEDLRRLRLQSAIDQMLSSLIR